MMEPAVEALTRLAGTVRPAAPKIPYLSNVTGTWITAADLAGPRLLGAPHGRSRCASPRGSAELLREPDRVMVEVGPGGTLSALVRQHPEGGAGRLAVGTLRRASEEGSDLALLLDALGRLWVDGRAVDPEAALRRRAAAPGAAADLSLRAPAVLDRSAARRRDRRDRPPRPRPAPAPTSRTGSGRRPGSRRRWRRPPSPRGTARWLVFLDAAGLGRADRRAAAA